MSKRLQVILDDEEFDEIRATAERSRMTVAEWVRRSLREARATEPRRTVEERLRASAHEFPTGDIDEMLADISRGRSAGTPG